jgi:hypothetical protein
MIEKTLKGRYLKKIGLFEDSCRPPTPHLPEHFVEAIGHHHHILPSARSEKGISGKKTSEICDGPIADTRRAFVWLPYVPGKVTYVREGGYDILTGKISGCWIMRFLLDGVRYVAHVGTEQSSTSANTLRAYAAWDAAVSDWGVSLSSAFNPTRSLSVTQLLSVDNHLSKEFYCVIDRFGRAYSLVLGLTAHTTWKSRKKISGVYPIPSLPFVR